jgi:bisphosphoglycerate-dependent phosphoglycerate mutase
MSDIKCLHQEWHKILHIFKCIILAHQSKLQKLIQSLNGLEDNIILLVSQKMCESNQ